MVPRNHPDPFVSLSIPAVQGGNSSTITSTWASRRGGPTRGTRSTQRGWRAATSCPDGAINFRFRCPSTRSG